MRAQLYTSPWCIAPSGSPCGEHRPILPLAVQTETGRAKLSLRCFAATFFGDAQNGGDTIPCPHYNLIVVSRAATPSHPTDGSAVAKAAYQTGEKLYCEREHRTKHYGHEDRIQYTEIMLPSHVPKKYADRHFLWNSVEAVEKQSNAQLCRRIIMAQPRELSEEENIRLLRQYCQEQFVDKGMIADIAFHYDNDGNPHAHVLLTMRAIGEDGEWAPKCRKVYDLDENGERIKLKSGRWKSHKVNIVDWNDRKYCEVWRHEWEVLQNKYLEKAGRAERVDLRSYERQGNGLIPTVHLGPAASAMERKGIQTFLGNINRTARQTNGIIRSIVSGIKALQEWIVDLKEQKQRMELEQEQNPYIGTLLADFTHSRDAERKTWSGTARVKCLAKDISEAQSLMKYAQEHGIDRVSDLVETLDAMEAKASHASDVLHANERRRKTISKIKSAAETIICLKPIHDAYMKKGFKFTKERYAEDHRDELETSKRAYAYLMKNHGKKLNVDPHEFDAELQQMTEADAAAQIELDTLHDDLANLRHLRYCVGKIRPELVGEKESLHDQLQDNQAFERLLAAHPFPTTKAEQDKDGQTNERR